MDYVISKMASVGCGATDTLEVKTVCDSLTTDQRDVLDCWYNNGFGIPLRPTYFEPAGILKRDYTEDDLTVMGAYVNAKRNIEEY